MLLEEGGTEDDKHNGDDFYQDFELLHTSSFCSLDSKPYGSFIQRLPHFLMLTLHEVCEV
jgi:hypothetical protein